MSRKHNEESDDRLLDQMGRSAGAVVCRARFVDSRDGKRKICTRAKGHSRWGRNGGHRA